MLTEDAKLSRWQAEASELRVAKLRGELTTVAEVHRERSVIGEIVANGITSFYAQAGTLFSDKSPAEIEAQAIPEAERLIATINDRLAKGGSPIPLAARASDIDSLCDAMAPFGLRLGRCGDRGGITPLPREVFLPEGSGVFEPAG